MRGTILLVINVSGTAHLCILGLIHHTFTQDAASHVRQRSLLTSQRTTYKPLGRDPDRRPSLSSKCFDGLKYDEEEDGALKMAFLFLFHCHMNLPDSWEILTASL